MGGVVDMITGKSSKDAKKAARKQQVILDEQERDLALEEESRQTRQGRARQGRRSLLYKEGDERGVAATLGG